jgi:hypothetical protein
MFHCVVLVMVGETPKFEGIISKDDIGDPIINFNMYMMGICYFYSCRNYFQDGHNHI